jgi:hypothetical protein
MHCKEEMQNYLYSYFLEPIPCSDAKKFIRSLTELKSSLYIYKEPPPSSVLNYMNQLHNLKSCQFEILFDILPSASRSPASSLT